jgi:uncharacterized protein (DUF302 family)
MNKLLVSCLLWLGICFNVHALEMFKLSDQCQEDAMNMIKCKLGDDVTPDDAIESMKLRANLLNFKLVGHMPLSEQVVAMGGKSNRMEIFQFCDAMIAAQMVKYSMAFAGYLPCRISLVVDDDGQGWLITLNMDKTMGDANLPKELQNLGMTVRNNIYSIITAGSEGEL